jgi:RHS repeat-associated protein
MYSMSFSHSVSYRKLALFTQCVFILTILALNTSAQTGVKYTTNLPENNKRSGIEVDPTTLGLNISIPLAEYSGRGVGLPVTLRWSSKLWRMRHFSSNPFFNNTGTFSGSSAITVTQPVYSEHAVSGWTSSLKVPEIEYTGDLEPYIVRARASGGAATCFNVTGDAAPDHGKPWDDVNPPPMIPNPACPVGGDSYSCEIRAFKYFLAKIVIHLPDGSAHELRKDDKLYPMPMQLGMYYAVDGSRLRYDRTNQIIYMPDGSRYLMNTPTGVKYIDRNGNKLTQSVNTSNNSGQWADTVGRTIEDPLSGFSGATDRTWNRLGVDGTQLGYILRWTYLSNALDTGQSLRYPGNVAPHYGTSTSCTSYDPVSSLPLFGSQITTGCSGVGGDVTYSARQMTTPYMIYYHNPAVLSEIILPNGTRYTFRYNSYGEITRINLPTGGYYRYSYQQVPTSGYQIGNGSIYSEANRGVEYAFESADGQNEVSWHYTATNNGALTVRVDNPDGSRLERGILTGANTQDGYQFGNSGFSDAAYGRVVDERVYDAGNRMLRRTLTQWAVSGHQNAGTSCDVRPNSCPGAGCVLNNYGNFSRNPRVAGIIELQLDNSNATALASATTKIYNTDMPCPANEPNCGNYYDEDLFLLETREFNYVNISPKSDALNISKGYSNFVAAATGPTSLARSKMTTYLALDTAMGAPYRAQNILSPPLSEKVCDGSGNTVSQVRYTYDVYTDPLIPMYNICQWEDPGTTYRGNPTKVERWLSSADLTTPRWLAIKFQYDVTGNVCKSWDVNGNMTQVDYTDAYANNANCSYTYAYPTSLTRPAPVTSPNTQGSIVPLVSTKTYDYNTGKPMSERDENGNTTSYIYTNQNGLHDPYDRLCKVIWPIGGGQTSYEYSDTSDANGGWSYYVKTKTMQDANNALESCVYFDGIGRPKRGAHKEAPDPASQIVRWSIKDTLYDSMSRVSNVSNPYYSLIQVVAAPPLPTATSQNGWTTTTYDALGRTLRVTAPDRGYVETSYCGPKVLFCDQANKKRLSESDALGRLVGVWEIMPSATSSVNFYTLSNDIPNPTTNPNVVYNGYQTTYTYDCLDNLTIVTQGSQTRRFLYDSLSRLIRVANPEQETGTATSLAALNTGNTLWSAKYSYDDNGNLTQKISARGTTTTPTTVQADYMYDRLNRNLKITYSDGSPEIWNYYDGAINGKGRLYSSYAGGKEDTIGTVERTMITSYDALGRPLQSRQAFKQPSDGQTWPADYTVAYGYDYAGHITSLTYPASGRVVTTNYNAGGRLAGMNSNGSPLVNSMSYEAFGGLRSETYGNGLIHQMMYNQRFQPTSIKLGTDASTNAGNRLQLDYLYGTVGNQGDPDDLISILQNNGNIARIRYSSNNAIQYTQTYRYDDLNRLLDAVEHNNNNLTTGARAWYQQFDYDRYGNRGLNIAGTHTALNQGTQALQLSNFSETTNRITKPGYVYDMAGNLTNEPSVNGTQAKSFLYDSENMLKSATVGSSTSSYCYNSNGQRVRRTVGGITTYYVYAITGMLLAEVNAAANGSAIKEYIYKNGSVFATYEPSNVIKYAVTDHLGTPRIWTDTSGIVVLGGRHDYAPFGEELLSSIGVRAGIGNYGGSGQADGQRKQFSSYERDNETGLDYAQARYYSATTGRFTSVDPLLSSGRGIIPQSWNRYSYVGNHPLIITDPLGLDWWYKLGEGKITPEWFDKDPDAGSKKKKYARFSTVSSYTYLASDGKWWVLDPRSEKAQQFKTREEALASQSGMLPMTAADLDFAAGVASVMTGILADVLGPYSSAIDVSSRDYEDGAKVGTLLAAGGGATSAGLAAAIGPRLRSRLNHMVGELGEQALAKQFGAVRTRELIGHRRYDAIISSLGIQGFEAKVGYVAMSDRIREEIANDAANLASGAVQSVTWVFYKNPLTGKIGPSQPVLDALHNAGITVVNSLVPLP